MSRLYYILFSLLLIAAAHTTWAQEAGVVVHTDPRLAIVIKKNRPVQATGYIHSGHGYRVQIYSGSDRQKATEIKIDFMRRFPGVATYMTFVSPHFRVKVGDYTSRGEAAKMYRQATTLYNPCMIVPDFIVINTFKE
jgi:hypothetical protein